MTERLVGLKWHLVDQIADLATGTEAVREHIEGMLGDNPPSQKWSLAYLRMCSTFLIITLAKLEETLKHFSKDIFELSAEIGKACEKVRKEIDKREIRTFRNKYAAHAFDSDKPNKKLLSREEGERLYNQIVGETLADIVAFCDWIIARPGTSDESTVLFAVEQARNRCLEIVGSQPERP